MTNQATTARIGTRTRAGFSGRMSKLLGAFGEWRRIRRDERCLLEQSDEALRDIGLARSDIARALRGALRGEVRG